MGATDNPSVDQDYEIVSIEPTDPPADMAGTDWHCYVIGLGENRIKGYQQGSPREVRRAVEQVVARMNERRYGRAGRVHLNMASPRKKASDKQS